MIGTLQKYKNNSHCKLLLPFANSVTENRAKGAGHVVTNNNVVIRDLATYSIPNCPNGATKAAYFDGSTAYLTIPYSDDFDYFGKESLTYGFWFYSPLANSARILEIWKDAGNYFSMQYSSTQGVRIVSAVDASPRYFVNSNNYATSLNHWYYIEFTFSRSTTGTYGSGAVTYMDGIGQNSTTQAQVRVSPLNSVINIGCYYNFSNKFTGYISEFTVIKGVYRNFPSTYNPTNNQKYYSLPNRQK